MNDNNDKIMRYFSAHNSDRFIRDFLNRVFDKKKMPWNDKLFRVLDEYFFEKKMMRLSR